MKILDLYIGRVIISTTLIVTLVLVGLSGLIRFIEEMQHVGRGNYDVAQVFFYVVFSTPRYIEVFIPLASLIGGLIGLGMMASSSELVIMRAAGWSQLDIIKSVMKTAILLVVIVMLIGEFGTPRSETFAREYRANAITGGSLISNSRGTWARDGNDFVHIGEVAETTLLKDITLFKFDENLKLTTIYSAGTAEYKQDKWLVTDTSEKTIGTERITQVAVATDEWKSSLTPEKLSVVTVNPETLSIAGLAEYLDYLQQNKQNTDRYELAFWRKVLQPVTVAVMLLVALSFISGPLRSVTMGARVILGIVVGFGFHITNQIFGPMSMVFNMPPILGALFPSLIFVGLASYLLRKQS